MKNGISLYIYLMCAYCAVSAVYADNDCDLSLQEARLAYDAGNYAEAKELYDYVVSECGANYGNAASWVSKCKDMLTPKLSVSRTSLSVDASSGSTSVSVTSNRNWRLQNTGSSLFSVTRNGDYVYISYNANPDASSRSDYFDVVTTDGSLSKRVTITQRGKVASLSVSRTSLSASSYGTTEYIAVECNASWEIEYPSGDMYSVTRSGNTLIVKINENTSSDSRTDWFYVKTTDGSKVQKISLSQTGKLSNAGYAKINDIIVDHNVYQDGQKGMKIHVKFDAYNVYQHQIKVCVYFHYQDGAALKGRSGSGYCTSDGQVTVQIPATASYTNTTWNDFILFMPYTALNMRSGCKDIRLEGQVGILDKTIDKWLTSEYKKFYFTYSN